MKINSLKVALITCAISLAILICAFAGTSFAWFNSSVSSGTNSVTAGKVALTIEYSGSENGPYSTIDENATVTDNATVYVKITNSGTVSCKVTYSFFNSDSREITSLEAGASQVISVTASGTSFVYNVTAKNGWTQTYSSSTAG